MLSASSTNSALFFCFWPRVVGMLEVCRRWRLPSFQGYGASGVYSRVFLIKSPRCKSYGKSSRRPTGPVQQVMGQLLFSECASGLRPDVGGG